MIREGIHTNAIYQHYKGDYYKVIDVAQDAEQLMPFMVVYHRCNEEGLFTSIRNVRTITVDNSDEEIIHQPFYTPTTRFQGEISVTRVSLGKNRGISPSELSDGIMLRFKFIRDL